MAFWIHGGGFTQGGGIDQRYNASFMVQNSVKIGKPIMVVNINYRLSAWGFLSGTEEIKESGYMNLGLRDQRLALQWVQENIEAFGGQYIRSLSHFIQVDVEQAIASKSPFSARAQVVPQWASI